MDANGTTTYAWDFENRLSSVVLPGGASTVTFKYDPLGRRIQKSSASGTTNYLCDGSNSVEEVDAAGAVLAHYAQGAGIDEPLSALRGGAAGFYEQDGLASVTSLSNSVGAVLNSYTYDGFGNTTASTGSFANPYLFTARDFDAETGLRYFRARYYDVATGRFISEDPIGFGGGDLNFYPYVAGSPLSRVDPFGLSQQDVQQILSAAQQITNDMTKNGERIDPGPLNNLLSSLQRLNPFHKKPPLKGCGEQADIVVSGLPGHHLNDQWTFEVIVIDRGFHQVGFAYSSNPTDPGIILDPWNNEFFTVPPGWRPCGILCGLGWKGN